MSSFYFFRIIGPASGLVLLLTACVSGGIGAPRGGRRLQYPAGLFLSAADYPSQRLFRVRYEGPQGNGTLRLMLYLERPDLYQIRVSDPVGRGVWGIEVDGLEIHAVDRRRKVECRTEDAAAIPQLALVGLPVVDLPALLLGRLPSDLYPSSTGVDAAGRLDFIDSERRRWSVVTQGDSLSRWTVWEDEQPILWWFRSGKELVLSHRHGGQLRWRQTVVEPLGQSLGSLQAPRGSRIVGCREFASLRFDSGRDDL